MNLIGLFSRKILFIPFLKNSLYYSKWCDTKLFGLSTKYLSISFQDISSFSILYYNNHIFLKCNYYIFYYCVLFFLVLFFCVLLLNALFFLIFVAFATFFKALICLFIKFLLSIDNILVG